MERKRAIADIGLVLTCLFLVVGMQISSVRYADRQCRSFLGVLSEEPSNSMTEQVGVWLSRTGSKADLEEKGSLVLQQAGYSFSFIRSVQRGMLRANAAFLSGTVLCLAFLIVFQVHEHRKAALRFRELSRKNLDLQREIASLKEEAVMINKRTVEYEENLYHQLKTPLTSLSLCTDVLIKETKDGKTSIHDAVDEVRLQIKKLSRLVTMFLRDSQLDDNRAKFMYELASLDLIIEEALDDLRAEIADKKIAIDWGHPSESIFLHCDQDWLLECMVTLLGNAVEAVSTGGRIVITLKRKGSQAECRILSEGVFLDRRIQTKMFERYYSTKSGHFGIGLHMAETIAQKHHGNISADNEEGKGATFTLILPLLNGTETYNII
ncbi:MAG: HAMP domain-containing sensor histidine kinase [Lachnospiraceae bacterium]|nr:HAMP domain-containing sensor histidine kinase [Lachnospiraceae bacterium]